MNFRIGTSLGFALALVSVLATGADAGGRSKPAPSPLRGEPFTVTSSISGPLTGELSIDGTQYRIASDARIYEVGKGFVPQGSTFYLRTISLSGMKIRNTMIVHSVMVRPESNGFAGRALVSIHEESAPR
jgi:hypothetical protein